MSGLPLSSRTMGGGLERVPRNGVRQLSLERGRRSIDRREGKGNYRLFGEDTLVGRACKAGGGRGGVGNGKNYRLIWVYTVQIPSPELLADDGFAEAVLSFLKLQKSERSKSAVSVFSFLSVFSALCLFSFLHL